MSPGAQVSSPILKTQAIKKYQIKSGIWHERNIVPSARNQDLRSLNSNIMSENSQNNIKELQLTSSGIFADPEEHIKLKTKIAKKKRKTLDKRRTKIQM